MRRQALKILRLGPVLAILLSVLLGSWPARVAAAEVMQVRSGVLLQVGDGNRSYAVQLGCVSVEPAHGVEAADWLREQLPRRTRVNLRPLGSADGVLLSQVRLLSTGEDLGTGLLQAGLARPLPEGIAPAGCPPQP